MSQRAPSIGEGFDPYGTVTFMRTTAGSQKSRRRSASKPEQSPFGETRKSIFDLGRSSKRTSTSSFGTSRRFGDRHGVAASTVRTSASRLSSTMSGTAAWGAVTTSSTEEIYQRLQHETGWDEDTVTKRYADLTEYRRPYEEDLDEETYVDIVNRQGQPFIRNVGLLRYLGPVSFDEGTWAGIELDSYPVPRANSGSVEGEKYFSCDKGLGMFIPNRYCRRSFLQRSRHDANLNNGAFGKLRLDDRGVWLVDDYIASPTVALPRRDSQEAYADTEARQGGDTADEAEEAATTTAQSDQRKVKSSRLLAALASRYRSITSPSELSLGTAPPVLAEEDEEEDDDDSEDDEQQQQQQQYHHHQQQQQQQEEELEEDDDTGDEEEDEGEQQQPGDANEGASTQQARRARTADDELFDLLSSEPPARLNPIPGQQEMMHDEMSMVSVSTGDQRSSAAGERAVTAITTDGHEEIRPDEVPALFSIDGGEQEWTHDELRDEQSDEEQEQQQPWQEEQISPRALPADSLLAAATALMDQTPPSPSEQEQGGTEHGVPVMELEGVDPAVEEHGDTPALLRLPSVEEGHPPVLQNDAPARPVTADSALEVPSGEAEEGATRGRRGSSFQPPPSLVIEEAPGSKPHRSIFFSPKATQVVFTPHRPLAGANDPDYDYDRSAAGGGEAQDGRRGEEDKDEQKGEEGGQEGEEVDEAAWAAFAGMEVTDVDLSSGSPRSTVTPPHRRTRSLADSGSKGKKKKGAGQGHARSNTGVPNHAPLPSSGQVKAMEMEMGLGAAAVGGGGMKQGGDSQKLVGPTELETYYLAAKLYLEENGVGWDEAAEAASFSRRTLFLKLNKIDSDAGATPKAGSDPASGIEQSPPAG